MKYKIEDLPDTIICDSFRIDINPLHGSRYMYNNNLNIPFNNGGYINTGWILKSELCDFLNDLPINDFFNHWKNKLPEVKNNKLLIWKTEIRQLLEENNIDE